ncbi:esterase [Mucilaginibacter auburnensis]|uniref:Enterochelin esterase family protein n=1 Tax=Mucilaginibacter auburnensis TaxID=1457233 RepID=A0A2H9VU47_9SPHI|nr:esterase [Mucilaginibacter auburnensis]PJJ84353.1 enterochelin esterase family protein [Mucilaginibacter auburnensis]
MKKIFNLLILVVFASFTAMPQARAPYPISPEVKADNSTTFRFLAPNAKEVLLTGEFLKEKQAMTKDDKGVWSITVPNIKPDIYPYAFVVDGIQVADPNNTDIFANERFKFSLVDVKGSTPLIHALKNVPHGKVTYRLYKSNATGTTRQLLVYTPPGFDPAGSKKYPVLYLVHGGSDTEETWTKVGKANLIADNLIAEKKAVPMIIVMPYANVRPAPMGKFADDVVDNIIPFIQSNYPVLTDQPNRAIAGFSVGGGQTMEIGIMNPDKFAYVSAYAPYPETQEFRQVFGDWKPDAAKLNKQFKLFSFSVGTEDFLYESTLKNMAMFKEKGVKYESLVVPGGHTWMNCKLYLTNTLPRLFK